MTTGNYGEGDVNRNILMKSDDGGVTWYPVQNPIVAPGGAGTVDIIDGVGGAVKAQVTAGNALRVDGSAVTQPVSFPGGVDVSDRAGRLVGHVTVDSAPTTAVTHSGVWTIDNAAGASAVNVQDGGNSLTVDGTVAATKSGSWTIDNAAGASAVNIQDGGNSITVDGTVGISGTVAATQSGTWTVGNAGAGAAVNIQDGGNSITVDGTVGISGTVTVDTELPAAVTLADATTNPTVPAVADFLMLFNGATWDRARGTTSNGLATDVTRTPKTSTSSAVAQTAVGAASGSVLASNANRKRVMVMNTGLTKLYLGLGQTPTVTAYHVSLSPCTVADDGTGGIWVDDMWQGQVNAIGSAAGGTCVVTELT